MNVIITDLRTLSALPPTALGFELTGPIVRLQSAAPTTGGEAAIAGIVDGGIRQVLVSFGEKAVRIGWAILACLRSWSRQEATEFSAERYLLSRLSAPRAGGP